MNSQAANMLDFDDAHAMLGHPGATIVPVALTIAEKYGKTLTKEVLTMQGEPEKPISAKDHAAKVKALIVSSPHENVKKYAADLLK